MQTEFSRHIYVDKSNINFMKTLSDGAELFHADRWTDRQA